jgi:L-alanine-DL-glutamate epimerase-like enolase superfamily enzyme
MMQAGEILDYELWQLSLPFPKPIATSTGSFSEVRPVVVVFVDRAGREGWGYALGFDADGQQRIAAAAASLLARQASDIESLLRIEREADDEGDPDRRKAVAAISLAAWDLAGRRFGRPCADLWGAQRARVPAYASALFLDTGEAELEREARLYRQGGYTMVKMRGGHAPEADAARVAAVRRVYPETARVAIDFVCRADVADADRFLRLAGPGLLWVENPVPYARIGELAERGDVAAGERCHDLAELLALRAAGVRRLILDVACLGGPLRFLEAARILMALGCEVGAHMYAPESVHLLGALPDSMPVEVIGWCGPLAKEVPVPDAQGCLRVQGPGLGRTLRRDVLARQGQRLV